ncbi:MAG: hypothetical protein V6Z86_06005 [Hyphomicrobiales bacterium]
MHSTIYAIHGPDAARLEGVVTVMRRLGAPTIRAVDCGDHYMALEGSHRLAAASRLDLTPELVVYDATTLIDISDYDWFDPADWAETVYPAGEIAGELYSWYQAVDYSLGP